MRILFACEFYYPSVCGVQEVMRHLSDYLMIRDHIIAIATFWSITRTSIAISRSPEILVSTIFLSFPMAQMNESSALLQTPNFEFATVSETRSSSFFFFKQKTAYEI